MYILTKTTRISYLVFVIYGGDSCFFYEDVHPFTYSFILSARLNLLHLGILISFASLLLSFDSSFTVSTWLFLLHLGILISSSHFFVCSHKITFSPTLKHSNIFLFTNAWFALLWYVRINFLIEVVTCCFTSSDFLFYKTAFF